MTFKDFVTKKLYLPVEVCHSIKKYLAVSAFISLGLEIYNIYHYDIYIVSGSLLFTLLICLMPISLYIAHSFGRLRYNIKAPKAKKIKTERILFTRYVFHLLFSVLVMMYLAIVLFATLIFLYA